MAIAAGTQVTVTGVEMGGGRTGICVYDNPGVVNANNPSAYVIFNDGTWLQLPRNLLTSGNVGFTEGNGPGY